MNINWQVTDSFFSLRFDEPVSGLSSAILGGGLLSFRSFLNLRVDENFEGKKKDFPPPQQTLSRKISVQGLPGPGIGMMTAASMNSFRCRFRRVDGIDIYCFLTAGLSNALAPADPGEFRPSAFLTGSESFRAGTINIAVGTSCALTPAAMTEAVLITTEAKSSVLFELGVKSYITGRQATGTGTDSVLVFSSESGDRPAEAFCGKHTLIGEVLASIVREALFDSVKNDAVFRK